MNMTIVIMSKRSMELALVLAVCGVACLLMAGASATTDQRKSAPAHDELPEQIKAVMDESVELDDDLLQSITSKFANDIKETMQSEFQQLLGEFGLGPGRRDLCKTAQAKTKEADDKAKLVKLAEKNEAASEEIRERIERASDNSGQLPQMSLGATVSSILEATSSRLASASTFIDGKMRSISSSVVERIPVKLKRFFRWPNFLSFKIRFHKRYPNLRAELYANLVFLKNQVVVAISNIRYITRHASYLLGQTQYSDMTGSEYRQTVGNAGGDEDAAELEAGADHERLLASMKKLDAAQRNIYGQQVGAAASSKGKAKARSKRNAGPMDVDYDELNEDEDEDESMTDEDAFGAGMDIDGNEEEYFKLVDQYASGADLTGLDDTLSDMEQALEPTSKFDPVDLRDTKCIIKPANQENCGICYAHVVTALATYHNCMALNEGQRHPVRLNARFVSDCGRFLGPNDEPPYWLKGCGGGRVTKALEFAAKVGIPTFHRYNWAQVSEGILREGSDRCAFPKPADITIPSHWPITLERIEFLSKSRCAVIPLSEVHLHLRTIGPVVVNAILWPDFEKYKGGVWDSIGPTTGDRHSMLIVGHDYDSQGREIYIVWNSHGTPWGERGFLRITAEALDHYKLLFVATMPDTVD